MTAIRHLGPASIGAILIAALLAACATATQAGAPPTASSVASAAPSPTASISPTDSAAVHATPAPVPTEVTCEDVLTVEEYGAIAAAGLEFEGALVYPPYAAEDMVTDGALGCTWRDGDRSIELARLAELEEEWAARSAVLSSEGWTVTDTDVPHPGAMVRYAEYDGDLQPAVLRVDGVTYFASPGRILRSIAAVSGD